MSSTNGVPEEHPPDLLNGEQSPPQGDDGAPIRALLGMLWEGKWIIIAASVAVVAVTAAYTFSLTPVYQSSSLLLIDQDQRGVPGLSTSGRGSGFSPFGSGFGAGQRSLQNKVLVLNRSATITGNVARRLDSLGTNPYNKERLSILYGAEGERRRVSEVEGALYQSMSARAAGREVDAINITVSSQSPAEAALIANLYAREYIERTKKKSQQSARSSREFLEKQAEKFRRRVRDAEAKLETFMQEEKAVGLDKKTSRIVEQLVTLQSRRDELQIELDMKRAALSTKEEELARIRPNLAERLSSGVDERLSKIQEKKAESEARIDQIRQQNPDLTASGTTSRARELRRLQKRTRRLEKQADSLAREYVEGTLAAGGIGGGTGEKRGAMSGLSRVVEMKREIAQRRIEVSGLEAQLSAIKSRLSEYQRDLQTLPAQSLELAQLKRERRAAEEIYNFVRERLQETRMAEQSEVAYAEMIQPAGIPMNPVSPNSKRHLMLGAFLGLLLGCGLVFLREQLDTRIRTPEDLKALGHHVLGVIPSMDATIESNFGGQETVEIDGQTVPTTLTMLTSPMSAAAEAHRRLRTNLRFARPDADIRSFVVTSPEKGEGKSTLAANLALAMASADQETLLVEADLRRPRLHTFFDLPRSPGLTEALYEEPEVMSMESLSVLTAGESVPNPSEVLGSQRMGDFIDEMESQYDIVIIDTPPLLLFSDPIAVVPHTDGSLLVASAGKTDRRAFNHAHAQLEEVGAGMIGTVLNRFSPEIGKGSYGYGYRYGYGYQYGYAYQYGDASLEAYYKEEEKERRGRGGSFSKEMFGAWWNGG